MTRRRYQLSIRQIMLLILLGTVWVQLHVSWHEYSKPLRSKLAQFPIKLVNLSAGQTGKSQRRDREVLPECSDSDSSVIQDSPN